jgi:hypothetical protein
MQLHNQPAVLWEKMSAIVGKALGAESTALLKLQDPVDWGARHSVARPVSDLRKKITCA